MERRAEIALLQEMLQQCRMARAAHARWSSLAPADYESLPAWLLATLAEQGEFWRACGAISRVLWAPFSRDRNTHERALAQAAAIRRALAIEESHPLHSLDLFPWREDFDEVVDDWDLAVALGHVPPLAMDRCGSAAGQALIGHFRMISPAGEIAIEKRANDERHRAIEGVEDVAAKVERRLRLLESAV